MAQLQVLPRPEGPKVGFPHASLMHLCGLNLARSRNLGGAHLVPKGAGCVGCVDVTRTKKHMILKALSVRVHTKAIVCDSHGSLLQSQVKFKPLAKVTCLLLLYSKPRMDSSHVALILQTYEALKAHL